VTGVQTCALPISYEWMRRCRPSHCPRLGSRLSRRQPGQRNCVRWKRFRIARRGGRRGRLTIVGHTDFVSVAATTLKIAPWRHRGNWVFSLIYIPATTEDGKTKCPASGKEGRFWRFRRNGRTVENGQLCLHLDARHLVPSPPTGGRKTGRATRRHGSATP
jgi:hypothetical protein